MQKNRIPKPGEIYNHFKNKLYQIITVATHSETLELMVVYQALYGDFKTYVRPLGMFLSEVDHVKYPEVKQQYRFEVKVPQENLVKINTDLNDSLIENNADDQNKADSNEQAFSWSNNQASEEALMRDTPEGTVNLLLLKFLDAESYTKKLDILTSNKKYITDRIINDMAVALDCAVNEGPIDQRIQGLVNCLEAMRRFEDRRMR